MVSRSGEDLMKEGRGVEGRQSLVRGNEGIRKGRFINDGKKKEENRKI